MRILINAVSARAGGGVSYLINLLQFLPRLCPDDQFLAVLPTIKLPVQIAPHPNLEIQTIPEASGNVFLRFLWENTDLIDLCHSWKADLLFCVANFMPLRNPGVPVAVMVQNVAPLTARVLDLMRTYESAAGYARMLLAQKLTLYSARHASQVIALSQSAAELIKEWVPESNPEYLYHGISEIFNPSAPRPGAAGTAPYLLYVSNLYVYKGLEYLVRAMAANPDLPGIFIAGKVYDPGFHKMIVRQIAASKLENRIIFLDAVAYHELPGWYAHAAAMVYTSWCENCPNILLEAMACGCPVVVMRTGPMPEICGPAAFYAEPFDAGSLAAAIRSALAADREQCGGELARRAATFTWENSMQQHARIFSAMSKPGRSIEPSAR
ncbi:MAG TPA: glycosyltransferase family 1 protein [Candidatus Rifleibacterium sp.]|nr:glycosyltransferase family 1 protein [Candidatus Rifleibacterium sp.]HPT44314.1 glycosyltransferase family 1 protein [Candidatus Rifleibacterium sp.]